MGYKGQVELKSTEVKRKTISGSTSATHTLDWTAPNEQSLIVTINGVKQHDSAFSVSGTTLTLGAALVTTDELEVIGIQDAGKTIIPAQGSVTNDMISGSAAIAKTKLASLDIVNADVNASAAIALSKLATDPSNASNLATGTVPTARLGSGTASSSTILYGNNTWVTAPSGLFSSYAIIADQKTQNTAGGTATSGAWRTRDLNTEIADPDSIVSISSDQFTLGAGSYLITWSAPAMSCDRHQTRLYDVTGAAAIEVGTGEYAWPSGNVSTRSFGSARITPGSSNVYQIEHKVQTTMATNGWGLNINYTTEQYTTVEIFKEA